MSLKLEAQNNRTDNRGAFKVSLTGELFWANKSGQSERLVRDRVTVCACAVGTSRKQNTKQEKLRESKY